jgi:hypothetical protein
VRLGLTFFCLGSIFALLVWWHGVEKADLAAKSFRSFALLFLLLTQLLALVNMISAFLPFGKLVRQIISKPVRTFLEPSLARTQRDYAFAATLSKNDEASLKFAAKRLRNEAEHCRARFGMLFGAIDRTGLSVVCDYWIDYLEVPA